MRRRNLLWAPSVAILCACLCAPAHGQTIDLSMGGDMRSVPPSYLGVSVENNELPRYERQLKPFARLLDTLQPPGAQARVVLRIGGESADSSFWGDNWQQDVAPAYRQGHPYKLTPQWMAQLGSLVRAAHLKVILDLNAAAHSPSMASKVAQATERALPAGSLAAFEVGNEPDLYSHSLVGLTRAEPDGPNQWAFSFTPDAYDSLFGQYVEAIRQVAPHANFAAPSIMSRSPRWVETLMASAQRPNVSLVTAHNYPPFQGCALPGDPSYPSPAAYLRDSVAHGVARSEHYVLDATLAAGLPLRLDEVGSAVCGGVAGRTDTFATALWAPDLLFNMLAVGVDGINLHLRGNGFLNTPLNYTKAGIYAEPLFYGMALFARTLGPRAHLIAVQRTPGALALKSWVVRLGDGSLHVLYINKSAANTSVWLHVAAKRAGRLERLTAPSIAANGRVKLAGQRLGFDGRWHGALRTGRVPPQSRGYRVWVPGYSAALLAIPPQ